MFGVLFSILAGAVISLQNIFSTRISEKTGLWVSNTYIHAVGFLVSAAILLITREFSIGKLQEVNKLYLIGGCFGAVILFSVMKGVSLLGPTLSVAIMLLTQLVFTVIIESLGLFGSEKLSMDFTKPLGILIMLAGIIIFKIRG